jgi:integration host factor subunit alpha
MTKADIAEKISDKCRLNKKESQDIIEELFSIMKETLEGGEELKISGFGKFEVKQKRPRKGRNPQTGQALTISARRILSFKPSALLREALNR